MSEGPRPSGRGRRWALLTFLLGAGLIALVALFPFDAFLSTGAPEEEAPVAAVRAATSAFGVSGAVRIQLVLPAERFRFPFEVRGAANDLAYRWVRAEDSVAVVEARALVPSGEVVAPPRSGFFRMEIVEGERLTVVDSILVGVMVPYEAKVGSSLNGYKIGSLRPPREAGSRYEPPRGFVEVTAQSQEFAVSRSLRLHDFITHDGQQERWPKYLALETRVLDKVELVLQQVMALNRGSDSSVSVRLTSGYRTPLHNQRVSRAATDSRHQYGDAVDIAVDADGDGRITTRDLALLERAVEAVERQHPALVGGLGIYGNSGGPVYVHIDVRGTRSRWRG